MLLPGVAAVGHLGVCHRDRQAQGTEDVPACRDHPRRARNRASAIMTPWMSAVTPLSAAASAFAR
jgi:hypothetical protein